MRRTPCDSILLITLLLAAVTLATGQQRDASNHPAPAYRLTLYLSEAVVGKPAEVHKYQMRLSQSSRSNSISTGESVPVSAGNGQYTYQKVGTSLNCVLLRAGDRGLALVVSVEASRTSVGGTDAPRPVSSQAQSSVETTVPLGRRVTIASFENAVSHTAYQLALEAVTAPDGQ